MFDNNSFWTSDLFNSMATFGASSFKIEAKKTNNFDKYNNEYTDTQKLIHQKKESMELVLKQERFKTLKIELEKMKKDV